MIKGVKVRIKGKKLSQHLRARALHHEERAKLYSKQVTELRKDLHRDAEQAVTSNYGSNQRPVDAMEERVREHKRKAIMFKFLAEHLASEVYELDQQDLRSLEVGEY